MKTMRQKMLNGEISYHDYMKTILERTGLLEKRLFDDELLEKIADMVNDYRYDFPPPQESIRDSYMDTDQRIILAWENFGKNMLAGTNISKVMNELGDWLTPAGLVSLAKRKAMVEAFERFPEKRPIIVTHKAPRHADDWIAIAIVKNYVQYADYVEIHPQDKEAIEKYKKMKNAYLIDVGGEYDPEMRNFDHHQDPTISSSFILVADYFNRKIGRAVSPSASDLMESQAIQEIDFIDRNGFPSARKRFNIPNDPEAAEKMRMILMKPPLEHKVARETVHLLRDIEIENAVYWKSDKKHERKFWHNGDFFKELYLRIEDTDHIKEVKKIIEEERKKFIEALKRSRVEEVNGYKIIVSDTSLRNTAEAFKKLDGDLLIERNSMSPDDTSVIKNTAREGHEKIDVAKIAKAISGKEPKFVHNSGFIAVVEKDVNEIDLSRLEEALPQKENENVEQIQKL